MKLIFWYIFRALAWFSLWNIIDFIEFLKSMLCRFKRGSQRAGPSDQPSASGLFLAQSLIALCQQTRFIVPVESDGADRVLIVPEDSRSHRPRVIVLTHFSDYILHFH